MRISQARAKPHPPPTAPPLIIAIVGLGNCTRALNALLIDLLKSYDELGVAKTALNSEISPPALNESPSPLTMSTLRFLSFFNFLIT